MIDRTELQTFKVIPPPECCCESREACLPSKVRIAFIWLARDGYEGMQLDPGCFNHPNMTQALAEDVCKWFEHELECCFLPDVPMGLKHSIDI